MATTVAGMTPAPTVDPARVLLDRVRTLLSDGQLREVRMFGVIAVMVDNAMAVAAHKDGSLLVRVDPAEDASLLASPHASRAEMGNGRSMGEGWIRVDASGIRTDPALREWIDAAMRYRGRRKTGVT